MTPRPERMTRVDTAWLRMDNPRNLMMIVGVWLLQPALDHAAYCQRLEETLLKFSRFRSKAVRGAVLSYWVPDASFDLQRHVVRETLRRRRGQSERAALQQRAAELAAQPLDPAHPLWQVHFIERYEGGSALIVRIHHCIADGVALNALVLSMADGAAPLWAGHEVMPDTHAEDDDWLAQTVLHPLTSAAVKAIGFTGDSVSSAVNAIAHPERPVDGSLKLLRNSGLVLRDAARLALLPDDSPTLLKGPLSGKKVVAWCEPLALDPVKAVGKALNCSVNDVLLSCAAGAIGAHLAERGEDPTGKQIRAMVPVNLRPLEDAWQLGNRFGLAPVLLPVGIGNPIERLYAVRANMHELKDSFEPLLAYGLLHVSGLLTPGLQNLVSHQFLKKTTGVMTNVPGPTQPIKVCGSTLRQSIFWVPSSGDVGLGVSIVSYAGGVQFGLVTDAARCPNPQDIIDRFTPEFERLLLLTLMLPWAEVPAPVSGPVHRAPPARAQTSAPPARDQASAPPARAAAAAPRTPSPARQSPRRNPARRQTAAA